MTRRGRERLRGSLSFALVSSLIATGGFSLSTARADTTDQLLDQLRSKGILTKTEYRKLKDRHAHEAEDKARVAEPAGRRVVTKEGVKIVPDDRYVTKLDKGIGVRIGEVDLRLTGVLSFFATEGFKTRGNATVAGGLLAPSVANNSNAIRAGYLPSNLVTNLTTRQEGLDLSFTLGLYTGGNNVSVGKFNANNGGAAVALGTPGIDLRQVFGTIGTPDFGTVKIGRDLGLFAADAVLNDATIPGVGFFSSNAAPGNATLGHVGFGYFYMDWLPQITYTTPDFYGFTASVGVFSPLQEYNYSGLSGEMSAHDQPGLQWRLKYIGHYGDDLKLTAWTSGMTQQHRAEIGDSVVTNGSLAAGANIRAVGFDGGARLDAGPVSLLAYGYYGRGMGSTFLFFDGINREGQKRDSYGGYAQASYTFYDRFTIGSAYGISLLNATYGDPSTLLRSNSSVMGFARYKLTDWITLQGEFTHLISRNQAGGSVTGDAFVLGTFMSF
ncbi:hypothetical protein [Beijerinckia indica]|uniref:CARD domain-containing protein n=1 Tax=Beijerinckia indica subsp. indica (strain ATCC 9039 / DSM 1715 / NCIMB 8712) TaxID=395963 RepID=B2IBQ4_BEII9|nr:hypothetical protein [Beijerinckia indica]ACB93776.1 conserved hypothetical protein [Beijerinckia indica subsp. indica ATCC 9039]